MAANPLPTADLEFAIERTIDHIAVYCTGKITSDTAAKLKATVKPLLSESHVVVLDLTHVDYMDSSGLGTIVGLFVSAKAAKSQLKLINLNERLKELFSITRLGQLLSEGRNADYLGMP
jgi:anti-sigma B factor antagonist